MPNYFPCSPAVPKWLVSESLLAFGNDTSFVSVIQADVCLLALGKLHVHLKAIEPILTSYLFPMSAFFLHVEKSQLLRVKNKRGNEHKLERQDYNTNGRTFSEIGSPTLRAHQDAAGVMCAGWTLSLMRTCIQESFSVNPAWLQGENKQQQQ